MAAQVLKSIDTQIEETGGEEVILEQIRLPSITDEIKKKLEGLSDLISLGLNDCHLASLANFPNLPKLLRLELISNPLDAKELAHLSHLKSLESFTFASSKPLTFDDLKPLQKLSHLIQLDLSDNSLSKEEKYREKIFEMFDNLVVLDNMNKQGEEVNYSEEEEEDYAEGEGDDDDEEDEDEDEDDEDDEAGDNDEDDEEEDGGDSDVAGNNDDDDEEAEESSVSDKKKKPSKKSKK